VPISLLAHITETTAVRGVTAGERAASSTCPVGSTGTNEAVAPAAAANQAAESRTAWCSTAEVTISVRPRSTCDQ
jgi:hypothetical protein